MEMETYSVMGEGRENLEQNSNCILNISNYLVKNRTFLVQNSTTVVETSFTEV